MNLCPKCQSTTAWAYDCPGYRVGENVFICEGINFANVGKKYIILSSTCGNAALFYCLNENCDWQYRTPNERQDRMGERPEWLYNPIEEEDNWEV